MYKNGMHKNYLKQIIDAEWFVLLDSVYAALKKIPVLKTQRCFQNETWFP